MQSRETNVMLAVHIANSSTIPANFFRESVGKRKDKCTGSSRKNVALSKLHQNLLDLADHVPEHARVERTLQTRGFDEFGKCRFAASLTECYVVG